MALPRIFSRKQINDDANLFVVRRDLSGGVNTRLHGTVLPENQVTALENVDLRVPGQTSKRNGNDLIEDLGGDAGSACFGFNPDGGTNQIVVLHGAKLETSNGGTFTERKTDFTATTLATMLKIGESGEGDVLVIQNGTDNAFRMTQGYSFQDLGDTNTSPPKSLANTYYGNRWWVLKDNNLYFSDAFDSDYSGAFDRTTNFFRIPCGTARALVGLRNEGILCFGEDSVWGISPSATPVATDLPQKILDIGCVATKSVCQVGNDVYFMAKDGIRGLYRSQQDKLQSANTFPISWVLKDVIDRVNWAQVSRATAVWFDNTYLISLPVDGSTTNNIVLAYFPSTQGWSVWTGWNVSDWATIRLSGKDRLFYTDSTSGKVYEAMVLETFTDEGVAISYSEEGRKEDLGQPLVTKSGGEIYVKFLATGDVTARVYADFDDNGYTLLGTVNLSGNLTRFDVWTLPFIFGTANVVKEKFPIDQFGEWLTCRIKIEDTTGLDDLVVLERGIVTYADSYIPEEN